MIIQCEVSYTKISILYLRCSHPGWILEFVVRVVEFQLKASQEFRNEKRGEAADVNDDVMSKQSYSCAVDNKWSCSKIGTRIIV